MRQPGRCSHAARSGHAQAWISKQLQPVTPVETRGYFVRTSWLALPQSAALDAGRGSAFATPFSARLVDPRCGSGKSTPGRGLANCGQKITIIQAPEEPSPDLQRRRGIDYT